MGNFWIDYVGIDPEDDFVGDTDYTVPTSGALDHFPFCDDGNDIAPVFLSTGLPAFCGIAAPSFALNLKEPYVDEIWVSYNNSATNYTCGAAGFLPQWGTLGNGTFIVKFWANDTDNYVGSVTILVHKDIEAPRLFVDRIHCMCDCEEDKYRHEFWVDATDAQLDRTWYTIGTSPTRYYFTGKTVTIDEAAWAALPAGEVTITFYANDTLGNLRTYPMTITKILPEDWGWLWFVAIGGIIGVVIMLIVLLRKKRNQNVNRLMK